MQEKPLHWRDRLKRASRKLKQNILKKIKTLKNIKNEQHIIIDNDVDGSATVNEVIPVNDDDDDLTMTVVKPIHLQIG